MFFNCKSLQKIGTVTMNNVTEARKMFSDVEWLEEIHTLNLINVKDTQGMFVNSSHLQLIRNLNINGSTPMHDMFWDSRPFLLIRNIFVSNYKSKAVVIARYPHLRPQYIIPNDKMNSYNLYETFEKLEYNRQYGYKS